MRHKKKIVLRGLSSLSALGANTEEIAASLQNPVAKTTVIDAMESSPVFPLSVSAELEIEELRRDDRLRGLDRVALLAIASARQTVSSWPGHVADIGFVSIGSARGATSSLEGTMQRFIEVERKVPVHTSPTTTAGNISSWVAQDLLGRSKPRGLGEPVVTLGTSMTCTSGFHSLLSAYAFLQAGLASTCLVGGAEACLTPYTIAQIQALRICGEVESEWPCRPLAHGDGARNAVVLGEGVGTALLLALEGPLEDGDLELLGIGWSLEETPSATGISSDGRAFEAAMRMACGSVKDLPKVAAVVAHAPGTAKGDEAELLAVERCFGDVAVCTTKHLTGHTYGASGFLSLELARYLLRGGGWSGLPYSGKGGGFSPGRAGGVLVNTAGFGGNCISLLVATGG